MPLTMVWIDHLLRKWSDRKKNKKVVNKPQKLNSMNTGIMVTRTKMDSSAMMNSSVLQTMPWKIR